MCFSCRLCVLGSYLRRQTGSNGTALRLPAGRKAAQLIETVATLSVTDPCDALAAAQDCLNEAATNENERSCLLDAACAHLLESTKEADIRKATDALAKLDGELRRRHPVTSKPRREMVDELVALGFEENVALKACRMTDNGALEARVAFCLEQAGKEAPPEDD